MWTGQMQGDHLRIKDARHADEYQRYVAEVWAAQQACDDKPRSIRPCTWTANRRYQSSRRVVLATTLAGPP